MTKTAHGQNTRIKLSSSDRVIHLIIALLIILFCITIIIPFWNMFVLAFNDGGDTARGGVWIFPRKFTLENFVEVFRDGDLLNGYRITLARTFLGTTLSVFLLTMSGYVLTVRTLPGRGFFSMAIAFTMLFGGGLIPNYIQYYNLGLINTLWIYIFPGCIGAWNLIMVRTFMDGIPASLSESARLDGCNYWSTYWRIILPLSKSVIAVMVLYAAVGHWNDWFSGAFYQRQKNMWPAQTVLQQMLNRSMARETLTVEELRDPTILAAKMNNVITSDSLKMAAVVITMTPILCVYPFIQKYFAKGVMIGSVKG